MATSYEISKLAEKDWRSIVGYTIDNFGKLQVEKYTSSLLKCLDDSLKEKGKYKVINVNIQQILKNN